MSDSEMSASTARNVLVGSPFIRTHVGIDQATFEGRPDGKQRSMYMYRADLFDPIIRRSLLYFDRIEWPVSSVYDSRISGFEILEEQQFITHTRIDTVIPPGARFNIPWEMTQAHSFAFQHYESQERGAWVFAPLAPDQPWWGEDKQEPENLVEKRAVQFELYNALPVPAPEVPFADILDYKTRRHAELLALRGYQDDLYQDIMRSGDFPHAKTTALVKLDGAIRDVAATLGQSGILVRWASGAFDLLVDVDGGRGAGELLAGSSCAHARRAPIRMCCWGS